MSDKATILSKSQAHTAADLRLVISRLVRSMRQHNTSGLTPSQVSALATIEEFGPIRISELAARETVGAPVATRMIASLEELHYICRVQDSLDKRACLVKSTPTGHRVLKNLREERTAGINQRIQMLSKSEIAALNAALPVLDKLARTI